MRVYGIIITFINDKIKSMYVAEIIEAYRNKIIRSMRVSDYCDFEEGSSRYKRKKIINKWFDNFLKNNSETLSKRVKSRETVYLVITQNSAAMWEEIELVETREYKSYNLYAGRLIAIFSKNESLTCVT